MFGKLQQQIPVGNDRFEKKTTLDRSLYRCGYQRTENICSIFMSHKGKDCILQLLQDKKIN